MTRKKLDLGTTKKSIKKKKIKRKSEIIWKYDPDRFIPSGSTMLNLGLSNNPLGGWKAGSIALIIGKTHSGKTFLMWQTLAEVFNNKKFKSFHKGLWYDDAEFAMDFNLNHLFGPNHEMVNMQFSESIEDFLITSRDQIIGKKGRILKNRMIYALDSLDPLKSEDELKKMEVGKKDYPRKPAILAGWLGELHGGIKKTRSLGLISCQSKQNIGVMFGPTERHSGGDAVDFYAKHRLWMRRGKTITKNDLPVGAICHIRIDKNKVTGNQRKVEFPIINDYGIDDIGSIIDWLIATKFWKGKRAKKKGPIAVDTNGDFNKITTRSALIRYIEKNEYEDDLKQIVGRCWMKHEDSAKSGRKSRY